MIFYNKSIIKQQTKLYSFWYKLYRITTQKH